MRAGNCVESLAAAFYAALLVDLPPVEYRQWTPAMKKDGVRPEDAPLTNRRPREDDVEVVHFAQTWGSTALGFGGMGGSAMTSAYTTVIMCGVAAAVYFAGRHAYTIPKYNNDFIEDVRGQSMVARSKAGRYMA
jgi:hypothetical protein